MDYKKRKGRLFNVRHIVSTPFIWVPIIFIAILDIFIEIYHRTCYPLYGLKYRKRSEYIKIDRHKLSYLNPIEKIGCMYCGYANGFFHYASAIAGDAEKYWCGIKHSQSKKFREPAHHKDFLSYGDEDAFQEKFGKKKDKMVEVKHN